MTDLILTMLTAYDDYETELGFTLEDINNLIKKYKILDNIKCNERGWILLWNKKYISSEQFAKLMEIEYIDGKFWIVCNDFDSILPNKYEYEIKVLDIGFENTDTWYQSGGFYDTDVDYYWDKYSEKTLKEIIKYCIKNELEIDEELMTEENTILKNGDVYFNDQRLYKFINTDDLDDLKTVLGHAICEAQESADMDAIHSAVIEEFKNKVGKFEYRNVKTPTGDKEKLYINVDVDWSDIEDKLKDEYGEYDFESENYGGLVYIMREFDMFEFDAPNYEYLQYATIDKSLLNELTQNRLEWD